MKFLVDAQLPPALAGWLRERGHEAEHVFEIGMLAATDTAIAAYADSNGMVDEGCRPLHAIEYQGGGHFKGAHATAERDAVKKEALRRAGIGYDEVVAGNQTPAELRRVVEKLVQRAGAPAN